MTIEKCREVLDLYERELPEEQRRLRRQYDPVFDHLFTMIPKMRAMLNEAEWEEREAAGNVLERYRNVVPKREKFMRWLGFMQGVLWNNGIYTLDQLKDHNRPTSELKRPSELFGDQS
jgi:hypothetical protein